AGIEEMKDAVAAGRLALLPVERALAGEGKRYTPEEIAQESGVDEEILRRFLTALGLPNPGPGQKILTEADLEAAQSVQAFMENGLPEEGMVQVARAIGMATARIAEANRDLIREALIRPGASERDLAQRFASAARHLVPLVAPILGYSMQNHLREQVRRDVMDASDIEAGDLGGSTEVAVAFADLVDFTKLGERVDAAQLGSVAGRLEELAFGFADPPVRLVKAIGDAVMLVSEEAAPLAEVMLRLVEAADEEGESFPQLRAGLAHGPTLSQGGDYYGRPVNLASRITGVARPGSVLADATAKDAAGEGFSYSFAGERKLKGVKGGVKLFRMRRGGEREDGD
ncbi:MAG TPA: adenylate cyclase regulatory domain-containing protein, partial [Solirubrobacterales bacterium]|nr:adenylate cyclase regulatory domain-containing protein [Solirubrobacterales bacterium]